MCRLRTCMESGHDHYLLDAGIHQHDIGGIAGLLPVFPSIIPVGKTLIAFPHAVILETASRLSSIQRYKVSLYAGIHQHDGEDA